MIKFYILKFLHWLISKIDTGYLPPSARLLSADVVYKHRIAFRYLMKRWDEFESCKLPPDISFDEAYYMGLDPDADHEIRWLIGFIKSVFDEKQTQKECVATTIQAKT